MKNKFFLFFILLFLRFLCFGEAFISNFYMPITSSSLYMLNYDSEGDLENIKIIFKEEDKGYTVIKKYGNRVKASFILYDKLIYSNVTVPISLEKISNGKFEDFYEASKYIVDWDLLLPKYNVLNNLSLKRFVSEIDKNLDKLNLVDGEATDKFGQWTSIADGNEFDEENINSYGFVKWIMDGFYKPRTGYYLDLEDLVRANYDLRGNKWSFNYENDRAPYFGIDWTRNIAFELASLDNSNIELTDLDIKNIEYLNYYKNVGYEAKYLEFILYYLAVKYPGLMYLASYNHIEDSGEIDLLEFYKVAVIVPIIDYNGLLKVYYFENGKNKNFLEVKSSINDEYVHLVKIRTLRNYKLPPVKNLSILFR